MNFALDHATSTADSYAGDIAASLAWQWMCDGTAILVDVRTEAERVWVGRIPGAIAVAWKEWPGMAAKPDFEQALKAALPPHEKPVKLLMLCRSGARSIAAARCASAAGFEAYNILEGFEGDLDANHQRGQTGGWRRQGLPWQQS